MTAATNETTEWPTRFRVGSAVADADANELRSDAAVQRIEGRTMAVLVFLARHAGDVARREAIMAEVWRGRIVTDDSLTRAIAQLRQALGDAAAIETIPKVGYRLKWPVSTVVDADIEVRPGEAGAVDVVSIARTSSWGWRWAAGAALVAVMVVAWSWRRDVERDAGALRPLEIRSVTPVVAIPGVKRMPRFSRDGLQMSFDLQSEDGSLDRDIWVVDLPTWSARQITRGGAIEQHADWTADGTALVYTRQDNGRCELIRKSLVTGVEHVLRECRYGAFVRPRVSPDGKSIVYSDLIENGTQAVLFEVALSSGKKRQLTHPEPGWFDLNPEYSPDGRQVLFGHATLAAVRNLHLLDLATGKITVLHREPGILTDATMERDDVLLFATQRSGQMQLLRRDVLGHEQALPLSADFIRGPVLSPDRQRLAYESWTIRQRLVRANVNAAESRDVSVSSRIDRAPRLSPDGGRMAFVSTRDGYVNIWLNEGGAERQLTHFRTDVPETLSWHPLRPWIAFSITRPEGAFACMIDVSVAQPDAQCSDASGRAAPFWSPDGQWFRFAAPDGAGYSVYEIDSVRSTATPRRIIADAFLAQPRPGGGHCFQRAGRDGIWCDGASGERLVIPEHHWFGSSNWVLDGDTVYALQLDGRLLKASAESGPVVEVGRLPGRLHPLTGLNRTKDGDFLYAALTTYESELMLVDIATH